MARTTRAAASATGGLCPRAGRASPLEEAAQDRVERRCEDDPAVHVLGGGNRDRVRGGDVHQGEDGRHRGAGAEVDVRRDLLEQRRGARRIGDHRRDRELARRQLPEVRRRVHRVQVHSDVVRHRDAQVVEPGDDGVGRVEVQRLDGHGPPSGQRQAQRARDLEDVGAPPGRVEHEDLLGVVGALHDRQEVVLALGEKRRRHRHVMHRMVDLVEADADPPADEGEDREHPDSASDEQAENLCFIIWLQHWPLRNKMQINVGTIT